MPFDLNLLLLIFSLFSLLHTHSFLSYSLDVNDFTGVCTNATAPSVSSINRILRNRAAERAAAEFARAAGYGLYPPNPYAGFPWPSTAHLWPPGTGFPGISPGSTTTASGTAGSPGSGSHDTLGSSDGSRMIGNVLLLVLFSLSLRTSNFEYLISILFLSFNHVGRYL